MHSLKTILNVLLLQYRFLIPGLPKLVSSCKQDKRYLTTQLQEMKNQSLSLFQKRDEIDELEGFQQQEMSKVKHMVGVCVPEFREAPGSSESLCLKRPSLS